MPWIFPPSAAGKDWILTNLKPSANFSSPECSQSGRGALHPVYMVPSKPRDGKTFFRDSRLGHTETGFLEILNAGCRICIIRGAIDKFAELLYYLNLK